MNDTLTNQHHQGYVSNKSPTLNPLSPKETSSSRSPRKKPILSYSIIDNLFPLISRPKPNKSGSTSGQFKHSPSWQSLIKGNMGNNLLINDCTKPLLGFVEISPSIAKKSGRIAWNRFSTRG
jgi:hypothetical protein